MMMQIELWHLITLLLAFFSCVGVFGRMLLKQFEKGQDQRFNAQEKARVEGQSAAQAHWDQRFSTLEKAASEWSRIERDFLLFKADLPMTFVMRDDYVRNQTVIEAKLDGLALRLENAQLKGKIQ